MNVLLTILVLLGIVVLAPLALGLLLVSVTAVVTTVGDTRSRRRMRRHLDELIGER